MSPPSSQALQELDRLDKASSDFDNKLRDVLYGQEYALHEEHFEDDDLVWLIDYLDEVCRCVAALFTRRSNQRRPSESIAPTFPLKLPGSVVASSEVYVAPRQSSRRRTSFRLNF